LNLIVLINIINFGISKNISVTWAKELNFLVDFYEQFATNSHRLAVVYDKIGKEKYQKNAHYVRFFVNNLTRIIKMIIFGVEKQDYITSTQDMIVTNPDEISKKPKTSSDAADLVTTTAAQGVDIEKKPQEGEITDKDKQNHKPD